MVIFDCNGVLVDSEPIASAVLASAFNRVGVMPVISPPLAELPKFIATEQERWGKVVRDNNIQAPMQ